MWILTTVYSKYSSSSFKQNKYLGFKETQLIAKKIQIDNKFFGDKNSVLFTVSSSVPSTAVFS